MWKKKIKRIKNKRNVMRANLHAKKISKNRNFYSLLCFSHQFQIFTGYKTTVKILRDMVKNNFKKLILSLEN